MSTLTSYVVGYALSILMTCMAFGLLIVHEATHHTTPTHQTIRLILVILALLQLLVQLFFFLHLGKKQKTQWNVVVFGYALFAVVYFVGGTLWIMHNLNQNAMQNSFIHGNIQVQSEND